VQQECPRADGQARRLRILRGHPREVLSYNLRVMNVTSERIPDRCRELRGRRKGELVDQTGIEPVTS
jgi:hypothetical protein